MRLWLQALLVLERCAQLLGRFGVPGQLQQVALQLLSGLHQVVGQGAWPCEHLLFHLHSIKIVTEMDFHGTAGAFLQLHSALQVCCDGIALGFLQTQAAWHVSRPAGQCIIAFCSSSFVSAG